MRKQCATCLRRSPVSERAFRVVMIAPPQAWPCANALEAR
jgi:hypothetical protein